MKRTIAFLLFLIICGHIYSQTISVSSFKLLDSDLTANTAGTMEHDQNGETAALIKVVTTQTGFSFDGGAMGIVKTMQKPSEIWVYIPRRSKKITISHPQLGLLRDYYYPISIDAARTYEMVLATGEVQTIVKQSSNSQYLVLKVSPTNAIVELDNEVLPNIKGVSQKFVKLGTYDYRVQAPNYHTAAGKVTVDDPYNKKVIEINLLPAFGWVELLSNKENSSAQVYIDNALVGTIPFKSQDLPSGVHHIRVVKPMYDTYTQTVKVEDNQVTQITPQLKADFSVVTINVDNNADIFVNEEKKGTGSWTGKLGTGTYVMEAKKEGHRSTLTNVDVIAGQETQTINLSAPTPIYGSLNITSIPSDAYVSIDGVNVGQTPLFLPEVIALKHEILITSKGYNDYKTSLIVSQGENNTIHAVMDDVKQVPVRMHCNIPDAEVYIDGRSVGAISMLKKLGIGEHSISVVADGYDEYKKTINVIDSKVKAFNTFNIIMDYPEVSFISDRPNTYINIDSKGFELIRDSFVCKLPFNTTHSITVRCKDENEINDVLLIKGKKVIISFDQRALICRSEDSDNSSYSKLISKIDQNRKEQLKIIEKQQEENRKKYKQEEWKYIQLTSNPFDVSGMTNVGDVTQKYNNLTAFESLNEKNRQRCIKRMKKAAAKKGAKIILLGQPYQGGLFNSFCIMPGTAYK